MAETRGKTTGKQGDADAGTDASNGGKDEAATEPQTVPVERLLAESQTRFGHDRHVLAGALVHAGLGSRVNLAPEDAESAITEYLDHEVEVDGEE